MEAFIFILIILGSSSLLFYSFMFILIILDTSTLIFCLIEGWKRHLDKQYKNYFDEEKQQDEEEKQDKSSTEETGGANP